MDRLRSPVADQRALATALRALREDAGLSLEQAATEALDASGAKLSRIETGKQVGGPRDVRDLCRLYDVPAERTAELVSWATSAREPGWWQEYGINDDDYIGLETAAVRIEQFEALVVPGILQTHDYAEVYLGTIINRGRVRPWTQAEIDEWLEIRDARQRLLSTDSGVELSFVLDEAALLRAVGGPRMRNQIQHIIEVIQRPNIHMRILPLSQGASPGQQGGFSLLTMPDKISDVAYVETQGGFLFLDSTGELSRFRKLFQVIRDSCPDDKDTPEELVRIMSQLP
jgi:transcriptional regulator with XRE-family HTH domain